MSFWKKLFGAKESPIETPVGAPQAERTRKAVNQQKGARPIQIDPQAITHAFIALTLGDLKHSAAAESALVDLNRHCQPKIWNQQFRTKFMTFAVNSDSGGFPDVGLVVAALEQNGLAYPSSIVANTLVISFDGGKTQSHIFAGFAFRDAEPRFILPYSGGCVAK